MNASSTDRRRGSQPDSISQTCPPWCTTTAERHAQDDPGRPFHSSGAIGRFAFWQFHGEEITATLGTGISNDDDLTAADLRQLAVDALAAAEWLEQRS